MYKTGGILDRLLSLCFFPRRQFCIAESGNVFNAAVYETATLPTSSQDDPAGSARQGSLSSLSCYPSSAAKVCVIVNPLSSTGKTLKRWPSIFKTLEGHIGKIDYAFTKAPLDASYLAKAALKNGAEHIIAVGGDGTLNEVVNGFFENDLPINPSAVLSHICSGTGCDFNRSFSSSRDFYTKINSIAEGEARRIDVGRVRYHNDRTGETEIRYFINSASCGLSGATCRTVNSLVFWKKLGGKIAFQWGVISTLLRYKSKKLRLRVDDHYDEVLEANTIAVCNGRFFGGGMQIAPEALLDDGVFDIIAIRKLSLFQVLKWFPLIYRGTHLKKKDMVVALRGKKVSIEPCQPEDAALFEIDGESPGGVPAVLEILPAALLIKQ